jgi:predicted RNA binding protein YcfA (HicA-like mRNA interferase family)
LSFGASSTSEKRNGWCALKYRDIVKLVERDGWSMLRGADSHRQYAHPWKKGIVTVAPHGMNAEVPHGTLKAILKQAGLK